ncbi:hypothetical protein RhiirC2_798979 [Rhizophagus irregularis]|uniref:Uncharacterized protein n=1 Tax=Rhizophagus irregularis TaxID=588596 RepID=A0A2N1M5M2_9GLOM|nr:hypothetical protein RhiirC2_798979 [Rhizophagus irregularis]
MTNSMIYGSTFCFRLSAQSSFDASAELHKNIIPDKKTAVSEVYLFGLQLLKCIDRNCKGKSHELKLHKELSKTTQIKYAKGLVKKEQIYFENSIKNFYNPKDYVVLRTLDFTIKIKSKKKTLPADPCTIFPQERNKENYDSLTTTR